MKLFLFCVLLTSFSSVYASFTNGTRAVPSLKFLFVVSKHGARTPTHTYPKDPYKDRSLWPDGVGQMTKAGKQQMFRVGQKLRRLYNGFLSETYISLSLLCQASLVDRTMISAATLLAGLFPPPPEDMWHPNISWVPVPVYPNLLDKSLLAMDPAHCPRFVREQNESLADLTTHYDDHKALYDAVAAGTGINVTACSQLYLICLNLVAMHENGLLLPNWAGKIFSSELLPVVSRLVTQTTIKNAKMIKILNGPFLWKIEELLERRVRPPPEETTDLNMMIHVGHDITLMCLLAALGLNQELIPWASTTLIIELHESPELPSKHHVQVLKMDGMVNSTSIPKLLHLPACKHPCDQTDFVNQLKKYSTTNWKRECLDMTSPSDV